MFIGLQNYFTKGFFGTVPVPNEMFFLGKIGSWIPKNRESLDFFILHPIKKLLVIIRVPH